MPEGSVPVRLDGNRDRSLNAAAPMKGNTMNAGGATLADGTLFQVSGYQNANPRAMNLLLAFNVDGK